MVYCKQYLHFQTNNSKSIFGVDSFRLKPMTLVYSCFICIWQLLSRRVVVNLATTSSSQAHLLQEQGSLEIYPGDQIAANVPWLSIPAQSNSCTGNAPLRLKILHFYWPIFLPLHMGSFGKIISKRRVEPYWSLLYCQDLFSFLFWKIWKSKE